MTAVFLMVNPQLYLWGLGSLLLVATAAAVITRKPSSGRFSWPESPLRRELRTGCLWIPFGTVLTLAFAFQVWMSDAAQAATSEDFLMVFVFGTIFGGIGCLCYWFAGYICGASFRRCWDKDVRKPMPKDSSGVIDPELDGPQ